MSDTSDIESSESVRLTSKKRKHASDKDSSLEKLIEDKLEEKIAKFVQDRTKKTRVTGSETEASSSRARGDIIPLFDPNDESMDAVTWLNKIDQLGHIHNWDDYAKSCYMQERLAGEARTWFNRLEDYDLAWVDWKLEISSAFPRQRDYATSLELLVNRKKQSVESMTQYYRAKMSLIKQCRLDHEAAISCVIKGLPIELQANARAFRCDTPSELYAGFLSLLDNYQTPGSNNQREQSLATGHSKPEHHTHFRSNKFQINRRPLPQNLKGPRCYNCQKFGHLARECRSKFCQICNKSGHTREECYKNKNKNYKAVRLIDNTINKAYTKIAKINGFDITAYIDTGSQVNILSMKKAKDLNLPTRPVNTVLRGFAGGSTTARLEAMFTLTIDGIQIDTSATVPNCSLGTIDLIVGQPIINKGNICLNIRDTKVLITEIPESAEVMLASITLEEYPERAKIRAAEETSIPPNSSQQISVQVTDCKGNDSVVMNRRTYEVGNAVICLPGGILKPPTAEIQVLNLGPSSLKIKQGQLLARGEICYFYSQPEFNVLTTTISRPSNNFVSFHNLDVGPISKCELYELHRLLTQHTKCFAENSYDLGSTDLAELSIKLNCDRPVCYKLYRLSFKEREVVQNKISNLLDAGVIRESNSEFASPIVLVSKNNGDHRLCVDYRALNAITIKDRYPLPNIDDQLAKLSGKIYFCSLDCTQGFHQIPIAPNSIHKTAFVTPDGQYEFLKMPMGLCNAPSVFQRLMHKILGSMRHEQVLVYIDDLLIPSKTINEGLKLLDVVLRLVSNAGLKLNLEKCSFFKTEIEYLGHSISAKGICPGSKKINAVKYFKVPSNVHEVRQFIGLSSYFRKFIKDFATIARPLTELTRKNATWCWGDKQNNAFYKLKEILVNKPVLAIYNPAAKTEIHTDASKLGLGGILLQWQFDLTLKPVAYFSRVTSNEERVYHSYELETLAVVESIKRFRIYIAGTRFKIITDCAAVRATFVKRDLVPRIARWWLQIQEFDFEIEYRPGTRMQHVDALSRNPIIAEVNNISVDDWFLTLQLQDDNIQSIINRLQDGSNTDITQNYTFKNNRLYRKTLNGEKTVVPKYSRWNVLHKFHDAIGHPGFKRCEQLIKSECWFPKMTRFIKKYVGSCLDCTYKKGNHGKQEGMLHPIEKPSEPMHTVHIDHLGPFAKSKNGNMYLLVVIDSFTKYIIAKPVRTLSSNETIKCLREIFGMFMGYPKRIISDHGLAFSSRHFKSFISERQIKHIMNAIATPRANGQVERANRTLLNAMRTSTNNEHNWDENINEIVWGINNTINDSTKFTPYELMFSFKGNRVLGENAASSEREQNVTSKRNRASANLKRTACRMKTLYDKKRKSAKVYSKGDLVLWKNSSNCGVTGVNRKLDAKYSGPYKICKLFGNDRYKIRSVKGMRGYKNFTAIVAADSLRPYKSTAKSSTESDSEKDVRDREDLVDLLEG